MTVTLLTEHHLELLSLKGGCTGSSESTLVKMPHCWKSHVTAQISVSSKGEIVATTYWPPQKIFGDQINLHTHADWPESGELTYQSMDVDDLGPKFKPQVWLDTFARAFQADFAHRVKPV